MLRHILCELIISAYERDRSSSPDQSHNAFGDHSAVENRSGEFLVLQTSRHHRRLRGMKTGYGSTGDADKHHREYGCGFGIGPPVVNTFGKTIWNGMPAKEKHIK
jgi:hypothetical protein